MRLDLLIMLHAIDFASHYPAKYNTAKIPVMDFGTNRAEKPPVFYLILALTSVLLLIPVIAST